MRRKYRWTSSRRPRLRTCCRCRAGNDGSWVLMRTQLLVAVMQGLLVCVQIWELIGR